MTNKDNVIALFAETPPHRQEVTRWANINGFSTIALIFDSEHNRVNERLFDLYHESASTHERLFLRWAAKMWFDADNFWIGDKPYCASGLKEKYIQQSLKHINLRRRA